ncbi:hypothetical protein AVEN_161660-1, partial [Araneus ventricosus]
TEYLYELLKLGQISHQDTNLRLQYSVFGCIISGSLLAKGESNIHCGLITDNLELGRTLKEFWEIENVERESEIFKNKEAEICEEHFLKNYSRTEARKFMVKMPFNEDPLCLGESRENVYKTCMQEYLNMGHIEEVIESEEPDVKYYIPYHCVFRPESNSTRESHIQRKCVNFFRKIIKFSVYGGIIQDDPLRIMLRFRKHKFAFVADIKKMYRMILIDPKQRDLLRILIKAEVNDPVKVYKLCTVKCGQGRTEVILRSWRNWQSYAPPSDIFSLIFHPFYKTLTGKNYIPANTQI